MELIDQIWTPVAQVAPAWVYLEEFGRNFYRLEGCPHWIDPEHAITYLQDSGDCPKRWVNPGGVFYQAGTGKTGQLQP